MDSRFFCWGELGGLGGWRLKFGDLGLMLRGRHLLSFIQTLRLTKCTSQAWTISGRGLLFYAPAENLQTSKP